MDLQSEQFALGESIVLRSEFRETDPDYSKRARRLLVWPITALLISFVCWSTIVFLYSSELRSVGQDGLRLKSVLALIIILITFSYVTVFFTLVCRALYQTGLLSHGLYYEVLHPGGLEIVRFWRSKSIKFPLSGSDLRIIPDKAGTYTVVLDKSSSRKLTLRRLTQKEISAVAQYHERSRA